MTTPLDRMRTAWKTDGRLALHRETEALAEEGTSQQVLEAAVDTLLSEARAAGADDETEEEILGVGDRLSGWCHASRKIVSRESQPGSSPLPHVNGTPTVSERPVSPA
jgi:hypothetical protein